MGLPLRARKQCPPLRTALEYATMAHVKAKLIFNPSSGNQAQSAQQLMEILRHLQDMDIQSEVLIVHPELNLRDIARRAARAKDKLVIVSGGDGTIESVALGLVGTSTTLGIIPTGTRNNLALALGIPSNDIGEAVALLRDGRRMKIDVGLMRSRTATRYFMEAGAIGLVSALFPAADDLQHGDIGKLGEFISTFISHTASEVRLRLDQRRSDIVAQAHMVLIANMPYMGANFHIGPDVSFEDRALDVFVYANLSKLDLLGSAIQLTSGNPDSRILRYRARRISITSDPPMSIMADGVMLGEGSVTVTLEPRSLSLIAGVPAAQAASEPAQIANPETTAEKATA